MPFETLVNQAASGANFEPETFGTATGIWDAYGLLARRRATLEGLLATATDGARRVAIAARIAELDYALKNPMDRRVMAHYGCERFSFPITGPGATVPNDGTLAGLSATAPWLVAFFLTGFDADTSSMWVQGLLTVPFASQG